jgi:peptidoglycan/LPS O-acetylase OafA/YrhL
MPTVQPSEFATNASRFSGRRRIRRIRAALGLLQLAALAAIYYFFSVQPSVLLFPALAVFVVNGIALLWLKRLVPTVGPKPELPGL